MKQLVTGAAGFIGSNLVDRLTAEGHEVIGIDDLSRKGTRENLQRLEGKRGFHFEQGDIRDRQFVTRTIGRHQDAQAVFHLAGQVAVTTSVVDPRTDFEINALGTFNVLEAVRAAGGGPVVLYSSTNKVYGKMDDLVIVERRGRYEYRDLTSGASEDRNLDFHSPYGCSKGAADQYIIDYARIYGLKTICLRQSCIYGYNQFGIEDQGWVAWFIIATILGKPITIYGDGKQVRDILFIDDLLDCYLAALKHVKATAGQAYNIGGGPGNTLSLLELLAMIEKRTGRKIHCAYDQWRPGDQKVFVCNIDKARRDFGWTPKTNAEAGVTQLYDWAAAHQDLLRRILG